MKLYLDTGSNKQTIVRLDDVELKQDSSLWHSQVVLPMIEKLLRSQKKELSDITEIKVEIRGGSFTGIRVGVAVANALGFALKIPVNGKQVAKMEIVEPEYG